jgi:hypothetical protein
MNLILQNIQKSHLNQIGVNLLTGNCIKALIDCMRRVHTPELAPVQFGTDGDLPRPRTIPLRQQGKKKKEFNH